MKSATRNSALLGAAFLMATSAIGPGFITQTTVFTRDLLTSFGFIILCSILIDVAAQLNIWRIIAVSEKRGPDVANAVAPKSGHLLALLVAVGGLAFNIGNVAGAGQGINVLTGMDVRIGAAISAAVAIMLFWFREAGRAMDWFAKILGFVMIGLTLYVAITSQPPVAKAVQHTFWPEKVDFFAIVTLVGGTVGGYISFAGAHRLLDAGITGKQNLAVVSKSSIQAILLASAMRVLLFLAALGVVVKGVTLDSGNAAASVFRFAAGEIGYKIFGVVFWCAAITSVVGSAYTSISFLQTLHPVFQTKRRSFITFFIVISTIIFILAGLPPSRVLVAVGTLNGFILPVALALMLLAAARPRLMKGYRHPAWLHIIGWMVVLVMTVMAAITVAKIL
ncbi:MAG TPA: NRAMP family divalent metal transporter [Chitinophagaceae bacterium]|nr:NRAMP family divalent metal transporter [Chitinophagaceae bacterium]